MWDIERKQCVNTLSLHSDQVRSITSKNGTLISGSYDKTFKIWDLKTLACVHNQKIENRLYSLHSSFLHYLVTGDEYGNIQVGCYLLSHFLYHLTNQDQFWDLRKVNEEVRRIDNAHSGSIYSFCFVDNVMYSSGSDALIKVIFII